MSIAQTGQAWRVYRFNPRRYPSLDTRIDAAIHAFTRTFGSPPHVVLVPPSQASGRKDVIVRPAFTSSYEPRPAPDEVALGPIEESRI